MRGTDLIAPRGLSIRARDARETLQALRASNARVDCCVGSRDSDDRHTAHVGSQRIGNMDATFAVLIVLQHRHHGATYR